MKRLFFFIALTIISSCVWAQETITTTPAMVHNANPGSADGGAANITAVGNRVYYEANNTLWMDDGSTAEAMDLGGATYRHLVGQLDGSVYFVASEAATGSELYRHEGTSTALVADLNTSGDSQVDTLEYAVYDGKLYFVADDGSSGSEVWVTNGTTTTRITDIASGTLASSPQNLTVLGNTLYFTAIESTNRELYAYDGASVVLVNNTDGTGYTSVPDKNTFSIAYFNSQLYFTAYDPTHGNDLWKYDRANVAWFNNDKSGSDSNPLQLTVAGTNLYWLADGASATEALYQYNGSSITIRESTNVNNWDQLSAYGDNLLFTYHISSVDEDFLVELDGGSYFTIASTSGSFKSYVRVGKYVYYCEELAPGTSYQLGAEEIGGAYSEIFDINPAGNDVINNLTLHNSALFFEGDDGTNGKELWSLRATNYVPEVIHAIQDTSLIILKSMVKFDLNKVFSDQDGDVMSFAASTIGSEVLNASLSGDTLVLDLIGLGMDSVSVTATDALGSEASFAFRVDVINPYLTYFGGLEESGANDGSVTGTIKIAITGDTFINGGGALTEGTHFTINNLPEGFTPALDVSAAGDTSTLVLSGQAMVHTSSDNISGLSFTFTDAAFITSVAAGVTDAVNATTSVGITFDVYPAATIYYQIPDITRTKGADTVAYSLEYIFQNPGGYGLTVSATSSDETVATTTVVDGGNDTSVRYDIKVSPLGIGTSTITITVITEHGAETSQSFNINVIAPYLTFSPDVSLLNSPTLTYEGKRTFPYFWSPYFSPDGNKILRGAPLSLAFQMDLNMAGDLTFGATNSEDVPGQPVTPIATEYRFGSSLQGSYDITFNADGTRAYISEQNGTLKQYALAVPYDLRSESTLEASITPALDGDLGNMELSADGNYLFYYAYSSKEIQQLELTAPYDISGGLTKVAAFAIDSLNSPYSYGFNSDGSEIYIVDDSDYAVSYYSLAAPYDLTTAPEYLGKYQLDVSDMKDPAASSFYLLGVYWSKDANKLYTETWEDGVTALHQYAVSGGATTFTETASNTGEMDGKMLITTQGSKFVNAGDTLIAGIHFTIDNLPAGLEPVAIVSADGYQVALILTGTALDHNTVDDVADLTITFTDAAFISGDASVFTNTVAANTGFDIQFTASPKPEIIQGLADTTVYVTVGDLQYNLGDYFNSTETLTYTATSTNSAVATPTIAGDALSVNVLSAGSAEVIVIATGETNGTASQNFIVTVISPYLVFGEDDGTGSLAGGFTETDDDAGAVEGAIVTTVYGDTFANAGGSLESGVHFVVDNLPAGFSAVMTVNAAGDQAKLTLTGQADSHDIADDVAELQTTFTDAAFESGHPSDFANAIAASTGFGISYMEAVAPIGVIADIRLVFTGAGTGGKVISLEGVFPDAGTLVYSATSSNEAVATVEIVGTDIIITPLRAGITTITITAIRTSAGGRTQSENIQFDVEVTEMVTALDDELSGKDIRVYPNPTRADFAIDLGKNYSNVTVQIRSLSGKLITSKMYETTAFIKYTLDAPQGVYILSVIGNNLGQFYQKIIKQ